MDGVGLSDAAMFHRNNERCQQLSAANTKFALDLYKHRASRDQNIFMSPLSISVSLAMTYLGARGQTKAQMRDVLHFSALEVEGDLHQAFADVMSALNTPADQSCTLYMANRLFCEKSRTFLSEFLSAGNKHYAAELAPVDFRYRPNYHIVAYL